MTLIDHEVVGTYGYYVRLIEELGLVEEFEAEFAGPIEDFELEMSEPIAIERVLDSAPDDYILVVNTAPNPYTVLRIDDEQLTSSGSANG